MNFEDYNLHELLLKGLREAGFEHPLQVQEASLRYALGGRDLFVQSQTGSGKTAAFLIPIFQIMLTHPEKRTRALVVAPTRELASQIEKEAKLIGKHLPFKVGVFYGGVGYAHQEQLLKQGIDIIVGTPGRLIDFNRSGKLDFSDVNILVIDEADRLFDMGFFPDLKKIIQKMPPKSARQTMLFSATLNYEVRKIAYEYMNEPELVELSPDRITVDTIEQKLYHVGSNEKMSLLLGILKKENPRNAIIFTNTKRMAHEVAMRLEKNGIECEYIIGDLPQSKRLKIIENIKSGRLCFLVATDVASRGLHIDDLELVVNYDLPENSESYVHRIGRTARVGKGGKAISLVCERYVYGLEAIEAYTKTKIPVDWADEELYVADASRGMRISPEKEHRRRSDEKGKKVRREKRHTEASRAEERVARKPGRTKDREISPERDRERTAARKSSHAAAEKPVMQTDRRKEHEKNHAGRKHSGKKAERTPQNSLDARLDYYRQKYGDNFKIKEEKKEKEKEKGSLLSRIMGIFKRKTQQ